MDNSLEDSLESLFNKKNRNILNESPPDQEIKHEADLNTTPEE